MSSNSSFNWGIIGPGRIAHTFAQALPATSSGKLYAVASRSVERGQEFAKKYGSSLVYSDYKDLAKDPSVDAIYIATPHNFHYDIAKMCLEFKKPVLCEKPLTVTAHQASKLIELARTEKTFLMEAVWTRFLPVWSLAKEWMAEGRIGDIKHIVSSFGFEAERNPKDRLLNIDLAGGTLLDIGIYNIGMSQFVMNSNPSKMTADVFVGPTGVDERVSALLNYKGVISEFTSTFLNELSGEFKIYGSKGSITVGPRFWGAEEVSLFTNDGYENHIKIPFKATGFEYQIEEAMKCIKNGLLESPTISWENTLDNMRVIDEILGDAGVQYPCVKV